METEVKLSFKDKDQLYAVASADFFRKLCVDSSEPEKVLLENTYLDTPDLSISKRSGAIRVRHYKSASLDKYEFTVKYGGGAAAGLHRRFEWNVDSVDGNFSIEEFKTKANANNDPADLLNEAFGTIKDEDLVVVCSNSFYRTVYKLLFENSTIEACFDSGLIKSSDGSKSDEICELELELIDGDVNSLNILSAILISKTGCSPLNDTKYRRTLACAKMGINGNEK